MKKKEDRRIITVIAVGVLLIFIMIIYLINNPFKDKSKGDTMAEEFIVVFETNMGNFEVQPDKENAPITVENFLSYVNEGFYDGLIFHRVISNFMIQGGGFDKDMNQKQTKPPIKNEADNGLRNDKYTLAMARTNAVDSATSQFFINVEDNDFLNYKDNSVQGYGYAVFGKVVKGQEIVDKIKMVETATVGYYQDVPKEPVVIEKAYVK